MAYETPEMVAQLRAALDRINRQSRYACDAGAEELASILNDIDDVIEVARCERLASTSAAQDAELAQLRKLRDPR